MGLTRLFEARSNAQQRTTNFLEVKRTRGPSTFPPLPSPNLSRTRSPIVKRLSPAELKDRRDRGLCFNSDDKFSPGHRCKKLFWIEGVYEEEEKTQIKEGVTEQVFDEEYEILEISLHAITRVFEH